MAGRSSEGRGRCGKIYRLVIVDGIALGHGETCHYSVGHT